MPELTPSAFEAAYGFRRQTRRGRPLHGAKLGVVILDTRFQRFPGDIGNAATFDYPVQYAIAHGMVRGTEIRPDAETLKVFYRAVDDLVALGVDGITTSCGFLAIMQPQLAAHSPVPVAASSLLQVPMLQRMMPDGRQVGVLTAKKSSLTAEHFAGVGVTAPVPVEGMPDGGVFRRNLEQGAPEIDYAAQEREVVEAAGKLIADHGDIGAIVLECTNLSPYSARIEEAFGLPVYDVITLLDWFHAGLRPRRYAR